jgi:hypothetical protein
MKSRVNIQQTEKVISQKKLTVLELKGMCEVLGLERSGSRDEVAKRIVSFLVSPEEGATTGKRKAPTKGGLCVYVCLPISRYWVLSSFFLLSLPPLAS